MSLNTDPIPTPIDIMHNREGWLVVLQAEIDAKREAYLASAKTRVNPATKETEVEWRQGFNSRKKDWRNIKAGEELTRAMLPCYVQAESDLLGFASSQGMTEVTAQLIGSLEYGLPHYGSDFEILITSTTLRDLRSRPQVYREYKVYLRRCQELRDRFIESKGGSKENLTIPGSVYGYPLQVLVGLKDILTV